MIFKKLSFWRIKKIIIKKKKADRSFKNNWPDPIFNKTLNCFLHDTYVLKLSPLFQNTWFWKQYLSGPIAFVHCSIAILKQNQNCPYVSLAWFYPIIYAYYLRKNIFYEMFFSIFLLLLPLYLSANFRARFCFMLTAIVNAKRVSCLNSNRFTHYDKFLFYFK